MPVTLLQAAQAHSGNVRRQGVIELFPSTSLLLMYMPFITVRGGSYTYLREAKLPNVGFRGYNEGYAPQSLGILNPESEVLKIAGGIIDVDRATIKSHGEAVRDQQEVMKLKAMALTIGSKVINGDTRIIGRHNEFDGLRARIVGNQLFEATGVAGTNGALSLEVLDAAIAAVPGANAILLNSALKRKISKAAKKGVGGDITFTVDQFGRQVDYYNGIPLIPMDRDAEDKEVIDFKEAGPAGGNNCTSLYVVNFNDGKVCGLQNGDMDLKDVGETYNADGVPVLRSDLEWMIAMACMDGRAAARIWGITLADVTE